MIVEMVHEPLKQTMFQGVIVLQVILPGFYILSREPRVLPVDIVMGPSWWNKHAGITFDEDFFYHPYFLEPIPGHHYEDFHS